MAATSTTAPLSPEVSDRLLDLLSTDDAFRDLFQAEPLTALRSIGYQSPTPGKMTACGLAPAAELEPFADCKVQNLADKDPPFDPAGGALPYDISQYDALGRFVTVGFKHKF